MPMSEAPNRHRRTLTGAPGRPVAAGAAGRQPEHVRLAAVG